MSTAATKALLSLSVTSTAMLDNAALSKIEAVPFPMMSRGLNPGGSPLWLESVSSPRARLRQTPVLRARVFNSLVSVHLVGRDINK